MFRHTQAKRSRSPDVGREEVKKSRKDVNIDMLPSERTFSFLGRIAIFYICPLLQ